MKRKMFLSVLVLVAMLLASCAPKATPTPVPATSTPKAAEPTATPKPAEPTATPKPGVKCMGNLCPEAGAELTSKCTRRLLPPSWSLRMEQS